MTREEAKNWLNKLYARADITDEYGDAEDMQPYEEALDIAIKALEQETVSKESYDHEYFLRKEFELKIDKLQRQLDKIRAEIKTKYDSIPWRNNDYDDGWVEALEWVFDDVIDKYKAESEPQESEDKE